MFLFVILTCIYVCIIGTGDWKDEGDGKDIVVVHGRNLRSHTISNSDDYFDHHER